MVIPSGIKPSRKDWGSRVLKIMPTSGKHILVAKIS
jgi:hypothetical protein